MKTNVKSVLILAVATASVAFQQVEPNKNEVIMKKTIDANESSITWVGKKITGKHTGKIGFKSGYLEMEGEKITDGEFVVDMTTINVTDLSGDDKGKLEGHLKSDDFFGVENHPTAILKIKSGNKTADGYYVNGEISIKGTTEPVAFDLEMNGDTASTTLKVDRTKFGVRYGSGSFFDNLGDNTIYDDFELNISLKFE